MRYNHVLVAFAALSLVGCAHKICLRTVDANTHEPLEGVSVQWLQGRHHMFRALQQEGPTNLPQSTKDGIIRVVGLHRGWFSEFVITRPGFSNVYGHYRGGRLSLAESVRYFPPGALQDQFMMQGQPAVKTNGCFMIEMHK